MEPRGDVGQDKDPKKAVEAENAMPISVSPLFTRRYYRLIADALRRFRTAWIRTAEGFRVALAVTANDGTTTRHILSLVTVPCHFGHHRYLLLCPSCARRVRDVFWSGSGLQCRTCCKLKYASQNWTSSFRLNEFHADQAEAFDHRPGRKPKRYARHAALCELHFVRAIERVLEKYDKPRGT